MSFLEDMFNLKAPFLTKKTLGVKSETHFSREAIEINVAKYKRKISSLAKVGVLQSYS